MTKRPRATIACLSIFFVWTLAARAEAGEKIEKTVNAKPDVFVSLCVADGRVTVRGTTASEVRANANDAARLEIRDISEPSRPASRLEVIVSDREGGRGRECLAMGDVELSVPRGAFVQLRTRSGDIAVRDLSAARVETVSGEVFASGVRQTLEAASVSGDLSVERGRGPVRLRTISGDITAADLDATEAGQGFDARTVSGDIDFERVTHSQVEVNTVSGNVTGDGGLPRGARYVIKTTSGDISLTLPGESSFQVTARVPRGEIINDFPLKHSAPARANDLRRGALLMGTLGSGAAALDLYSFTGIIHLRQK